MTALTHVDLFSGVGGLRLGLARHFCGVVAVERDRHAAASYAANHADVPLMIDDVRNVRAWDAVRRLPSDGGVRRPAGLLTAGFPCETVSSARNRPAAADDPRWRLYREALRLADATQARLVLFENVPRIRTARAPGAGGRLLLDDVRGELRAAGYANQLECVLDAADFGAATRRVRWFLLAARDPALPLFAPKPTHPRHATVREALAGLPIDPMATADAADGCPSWHVAAGCGPAVAARYSLVRPGRSVGGLVEGGRRDAVAAYQSAGVLPRAAYRQRGQRLRWGTPARTLTAHCGEELIHPARNRHLTARECLRLMGYPDGYELRGPLTAAHDGRSQSAYAQIGDSVCPPVAAAWGRVMAGLLAGRC